MVQVRCNIDSDADLHVSVQINGEWVEVYDFAVNEDTCLAKEIQELANASRDLPQFLLELGVCVADYTGDLDYLAAGVVRYEPGEELTSREQVLIELHRAGIIGDRRLQHAYDLVREERLRTLFPRHRVDIPINDDD